MQWKSIFFALSTFAWSAPTTPAQTIITSVTPAIVTANPGDIVYVKVEVDMTGSTELLGSFTASLSWSAAFLQYQSNAGLQSGFTGAVNDANAASGQFFFNGVKVAGASGVITVMEIAFEVGAMGAILDLEFSAMAAASTFADLMPFLQINDGSIVLSGGSPAGPEDALKLQAFSSRQGREVLLRFHLPETGLAQIQVYNSTGILIRKLKNGVLAQGDHEINWDGGSFPAGIYRIVLQSERGMVSENVFLGQ